MAQESIGGPSKDGTKSPKTPIATLGPYEQYVQDLIPQWPHLRIVKDFMSMDLEHTPTPLQSRIFKTDVRVIDVITKPSSSTHLVSTCTFMTGYRFEEIDGFENFLGEPRPDGVIARLFLVEDLSAKIIETLGDTFALDPEFFAQRLNGWWRHYQGYWTIYSSKAGYVPHPLPSGILKQNFQHFQFRRAYHWPGKTEIEAMRRDYSNLWRPYMPRGIYGSDVFLEEAVTSISFGAEDLWTGVYLFDPVLPIPPPLLYRGIRNFCERLTYTSRSKKLVQLSITEELVKEETQEPQSHPEFWISLRDETASRILKMSSHQPQHTGANAQNQPIPPVVSNNNFTEIPSIATSEMPYHTPPAPPSSAAILRYRAMYGFKGQATNELSLIKDEIVTVVKKGDSGWWLIKKINSSEKGWVPSAYLEESHRLPISKWSLSNHAPLELPLRTILSSWVLVADILNRRMYHLESQVAGDTQYGIVTQSDLLIQSLKLRKHAIHFRECLERITFILENNLKKTPYSKELEKDALDFVSSFRKIASRGDSNTPTFLAKISVEEMQKTFAQAETMKRLTKLAFIFVPISLIATVLGIQDSKPWVKYWTFVGLSIPILIFVFLLSREFRELRFGYLKWGQKRFALRGDKKGAESEQFICCKPCVKRRPFGWLTRLELIHLSDHWKMIFRNFETAFAKN